MTQNQKRSLRDRRVPKNFDSDNEQADPWGYSRPNYIKEIKNPSQQLNADAKLFIRFLNNINQNYREAQIENKKRQIGNIKMSLPIRQRKIKNAQPISQMKQKNQEFNRDIKYEILKKSKQHQHHSQNHHHHDYEQLISNQSMLNRYKTMNIQSANKMIDIEESLGKNRQRFIDQNKIKIEKMQIKGKVAIQNRSKQNNFQFHVKNDVNHHKSNSKNVFYNYDKEKQTKIAQIQQKLGIPKPINSQNKIFKRSAYHVAIAYFIYINQRKQRNLLSNDIDPTYYSRKLKQDMNKHN